jgi:hypothetical protein
LCLFLAVMGCYDVATHIRGAALGKTGKTAVSPIFRCHRSNTFSFKYSREQKSIENFIFDLKWQFSGVQE